MGMRTSAAYSTATRGRRSPGAEELKRPRRPPVELLGRAEGKGERKKARPSPEAEEWSREKKARRQEEGDE